MTHGSVSGSLVRALKETLDASPVTVARLAALMGVLGLTLTMATGLGLTWNQYDSLVGNARKESVNQAFFLADHASRLFEVSQIGLDATTAAAAAIDWPQISASKPFFEQLHALAAALPYVEDIWLNDETGRLRASSFSFPPPTSEAADRPNFKAALQPGKALFIGSPIIGRVTHRLTFLISRRLETATHQFHGMVSTTGDISYFTDFWGRLPMRFGGRVTLFRVPEGDILAQYPSPKSPQQFTVLPPGANPPDEGSYDEAVTPGRFGAYHRVAHLPIYISVDKSTAAVMRAWWNWIIDALPLFLGALFGLACLTALALRQARIEARSTAALTKAHADLINEIKSREKAEAQVRQMQKVEAIGQMTGGLAHDFNNMLAIVIGNLGLLQQRLKRGETNVGHYVANAEDGAQRAAALTRHLLAFARRQPLAPQTIDVNAFLTGLSDMLRRTLTTIVRIETLLAEGLWRTQVDPSQLENAILNLAINSRDAMPDGGTLTIETANIALDGSRDAPSLDVPAGHYVMIVVSDSGLGMSADVASKAFDPFFTTKGVGAGSGLGLSQVYGFVRQSGGEVRLRSQVGEGTTVAIYLPRDAGAIAPAPDDGLSTEVPRGSATETILIVEDEAAVRRMAIDALRDLGYTILSADNGAGALAQLAQNVDVALLFTDIVMPGIGGRELAEKALRARPALKILLTTGFTRETITPDGLIEPGLRILPKPYSIDQLARRIRDILDHP